MRSEAFADCGIEELVEVTLPAYTSTEDGKHVPAFVATLVATPKRGSQPHMKLDAAHLDWLRQAVHGFAVELQDHEVEVAAEDLPDIEQPNVRWFKRKGRSAAMCCTYWDGEKWRRKANIPQLIGHVEYDTEITRTTAAIVQNFYDEHHIEDANNEGA